MSEENAIDAGLRELGYDPKEVSACGAVLAKALMTIKDLRAALSEKEAELKDLTNQRPVWRCFHCGEVFKQHQPASEHFSIEGIPPMCVDPLTKDEKARMVVVRKLEAELVKWRKENEELDHKAGCLATMQAELSRYFGTCGGSLVKTASQAWLVHEAMIGAKEAAEKKAQSWDWWLEEQAAIKKQNPKYFACNHPFLPVGFEDGSWRCCECWAEDAEREVKELRDQEERIAEMRIQDNIQQEKDLEDAMAELDAKDRIISEQAALLEGRTVSCVCGGEKKIAEQAAVIEAAQELARLMRKGFWTQLTSDIADAVVKVESFAAPQENTK